MLRRLLLLVLCFPLLVQATAPNPAPYAPPEHRRSSEQTYLTFPEWYLVHSPAEYAAYVAADRPVSEFPFAGHIGQLWSSYGKVTEAQAVMLRAGQGDANPGYHVMIGVIASSTTAEYGLRAFYEKSIGRLAEQTRTHGPTAEEKLASRVAQDYVDFIRVLPWYEFDFWKPLKVLWRDTGYGGEDQIRKWERKYALTTEYGIKAVYAWIIKRGTKASYEAPLLVTSVMVDRWLDRLEGSWPEIKRVRSFPSGGELVLLPRYEAFKGAAMAVARSGANFVEIAGNGAEQRILVSVIVPRNWQPADAEMRTLFEQPIMTQAARKRVALTVPVGALARVLRKFDTTGTAIEHIYDY